MATGDEIAEVRIELVIGSTPIRGTACLPQGERREFWGWLELAEIVQQATDGSGNEAKDARRRAG